MVYEHMPFEMVALVLDDTCKEPAYLFFVGLEILVEPAKAYMLDSGNLFRYAGQA